MLRVLRLPRKTRRRPFASLVAGLPPTSMKVLQALRLPRKRSLKCSNCCACHAKRGGAYSHHSSPDFCRLYEGAPSAAPHLPRKTSLGCSECCACHAKRGGAHSHHSSPDFCRPLCRCSMCCLPRKRSLRCSRRCAYHAKRASGALSAAPATQNDAAPIRITRRRTSADLYEGVQSAAPATQKEPQVLQALRIPRKTSLRCSECCACQAKRGGAHSHHSSPDFCRPL